MGRNQVNLLKFALNYPEWHYINTKDRAGLKAMKSLERVGLLQVNRLEDKSIMGVTLAKSSRK